MNIPEKYSEALERALAGLRQACSEKGYIINLSFEELKYWEDLQGVKVVLENPKTGGRVELFLCAEYDADYVDLDNAVRVFKGEVIRDSNTYVRGVIAQIEVLVEELSRTGLEMRDEPAVKKAICMLMADHLLTALMWRELSTIARLCLDYGISLSKRDTISISASENAFKTLFDDYVRIYGLDENMKKNIKHILEWYPGKKYFHAIKDYFGKGEYALYLIGKEELTDDDCKIIGDFLAEAGNRWRMKAVKKIVHRISQKGGGGTAAERLAKVLANYLSSSASPDNVVKILDKIAEWSYYYENSPHLVNVCTAALSRLLKIRNVDHVEPPPPGNVKPPRYLTIYTNDGFKVSVDFEGRLSVKVTMRSGMIDEDKNYTYLGKPFWSEITVEDWEKAQAFVEESMKYFKEAFSKVKKILQRNEMALSTVKAYTISGKTPKIIIPKIIIEGDAFEELGSREDLVKAFRARAKEALKKVSIKFDEARVKASHQI